MTTKLDDVCVMFRPAAAYQTLARLPQSAGRWSAARRPLFLAFLLGCTVSLVTSQRLTLRLVAGGTVNMSFVPLAEIAALAAVWRRNRVLSFSRAVDLFFMGHGPWILGCLGYSTVWAFASPEHAFAWMLPRRIWWILSLALVWSAYIDYCFFRRGLQRDRVGAGFDLLLQRTISWTVGIVVFGGSAVPPEIVRILRL